jgi:hypothetical protein
MHPMAATTEEELRAITVGELRPLAGKIEIAEYDPAWPAPLGRAEVRALRAGRPGVRCRFPLEVSSRRKNHHSSAA